MTTAAEESQDTQEEIVDQAEGEQDDKVAAGGAKKKKQGKEKTKLPIFTKRDPIDRVPLPSDGTRSFTVLSWNVNGIRAVVKNGLDVLRHTVKTERPDLVCFQVRAILVWSSSGFTFCTQTQSCKYQGVVRRERKRKTQEGSPFQDPSLDRHPAARQAHRLSLALSPVKHKFHDFLVGSPLQCGG